MILPVQVSFRNVAHSAAIEADIRARAQKLESFYKRVTSCRVLVEAPARHHQSGRLFHVRIDLTVPGGEIVVKREPTLHATERNIGEKAERKKSGTKLERKNLNVAVREAFELARRRLQAHARRKRVEVKTHQPTPQARVAKLFQTVGYGYIETDEGQEIYFHAHSVLNDRFKDLQVGSKVSFVEESGDKGPQASTVKLVSRARPTAPLPPVRRLRQAS